jgi:hypothetical protein
MSGLLGETKILALEMPTMWKRNMICEETAQLIERFLNGQCLYAQEWNDFVDTPSRSMATGSSVTS